SGGPPNVTRVEQDGTGVTYAGYWYPNAGTFNSGGSATLAQGANSSATIAFNGTGVTWIGYQDQWSGIANVYVDGVFKAQVDTYSSSSKARSALYTVTGLTNGSHKMTITVTGRMNASASGAWVWVDAFDVTSGGTATPPVTITRIEQNGTG